MFGNLINFLSMAVANSKDSFDEELPQWASDPEYDWVKDRVTIDALEIQFNLSRRSIFRILEEDGFLIDRSKNPVTVIRRMAETALWNDCWDSPRIYRRWWREGFEPELKTEC